MIIPVLITLLWIATVRYPPLSYPAIGLITAIVVAGVTGLLTLRREREDKVPAYINHPAILPGFLFVAYCIIRWIAGGFDADGMQQIGTTLWAACFYIIAIVLPGQNGKLMQQPANPAIILLYALMLLGLFCGIHAVWQYYYSYEASYQALLASLADRPLDRTDAALLHHLKLRRVASIWGDPNVLATFSAVALAASFEVFSKPIPRIKWLSRIITVLTSFACAAAIYFSGSRGGVLDAIFVIFVFGAFLLYSARLRSRDTTAATLSLIILCAACVWNISSPRPALAQRDALTTSTQFVSEVPTGWTWRSSTIRERFYYLQTGRRMIELAPITGLGPGGVNRYFGRLKPPEARETRHLHNWVMQTWAEYGIIGLALLTWFLAAIVWCCWKRRVWRKPAHRALVFIILLLMLDGLIQVTWNQRELMTLFAFICGLLTVQTSAAASPPTRCQIHIRNAGITVIILAFLTVEIPYLNGATSKQIAFDAMMEGDVEKARQHLARASRWLPRDPEPLAARASLALDAGQLSAAHQLISQALKISPDSARLNVQAATIAEFLNQDDQVDKHLTNALELYPSHPEYNFLYAQFLAEKGEYSRALYFANLAKKYNFEKHTELKYQKLVEDLTIHLHE